MLSSWRRLRSCLPQRRAPTHDANGNTLSDPSGKSYTWDFENRLVQAVVPGTNGGTTTFRYDPFGRRIQKISPSVTSIFVYDGNGLVETLNGSGSEIAGYVQGQSIDEPLAELQSTTTDYYEQDALGSITSLSTPTAALASTYTYDSFGNLTASTGAVRNYFQYTGREFDPETNLDYYRGRYYDAGSGRFTSQDPIGYNGGYVRNNPILLADPFGLCGITKIKIWSSDEVTIGSPRSPWELSVTHQENADGILPINNLWCHWTREYNTVINTTTTYLVHEFCPDGTSRCKYGHSYERTYFEQEHSWKTGTTTKTFDYGQFTLTGFDEGQDFLQEFYCKAHPPSP